MMMLVLTLLVRGGGAYEFTSKAELKAACDMWVTDQSTAQATYGHISTLLADGATRAAHSAF